jgi:hypothetical protein
MSIPIAAPMSVAPRRFNRGIGDCFSMAPQVRPVAAAVVAEHVLHGDAALGEPGHRVAQDLAGGFMVSSSWAST